MSATRTTFSSLESHEKKYGSNAKKRSGCWVSRAACFGIVFLVAILLTAVALLVFFLHPDKRSTPGSDGPTTTVSSVSPQPTPTPDYRLPSDLQPYHYNVRLRPELYSDDPADFHFTGTVQAFFRATRITDEVVLHFKQLNIDSSSLEVRAADEDKPLGIKETDVNAQKEFLIIRLSQSLAVDHEYNVVMKFAGNISDDLAGLYYSSYIAEGGQKRYLVTSQAQPTDARKMFPCFDEPALKAVVNTTIERRQHMRSFANTEILSTQPLEGDWMADTYSPTPPMSTYILAFVVSDFDCVDSASNDTLIQVCARPNAKSQTSYAQELAGPMQKFFEIYHNETYPLPKMTHIALPDFAFNAMENWGAIMYRETALLYDPASSSVANKQRVASILSHELTHQWFGNLVTPSWWDDLWLNEGFASYMEVLCMDDYYNDQWMMDSQFVVEDLQNVLVLDSLATSHPVYQTVSNPAEISSIFDDITYLKGAAVIRMMHYFLGEEVFRWGLANYIKDRKYKSADHTDLFKFLSQEASSRGQDSDVSAIMNTWILQKGYPVVKYSYDNATGVITLTQKHFLLDSTQPPSSALWRVPISVLDSTVANSAVAIETIDWLNQKEGTFTGKANARWILGNPMERFYYRVNYDDDMWDAIVSQLMEDHEAIYPTSRAQLIDDSFNLGRSNEIDQLVSLEVTRYLNSEMDYTPWVAAKRNLGYLSKMLQLSGSYHYLQVYVRSKVNATYTAMGWAEAPTDSHLRQRLRVVAIETACDYGLTSCTRHAASLYQQWMDAVASLGGNAINPISSNFRSVVYCSAIDQGDAEEWNFGFQQYALTNSGAEKNTILVALACASKPYLLAGYLTRALSEEGIQRQDFRTVLVNVAKNPAGRLLAWNFLRENWDTVFSRFGQSTYHLVGMVAGVTESFSTGLELEQLKAFMESQDDLGPAERTFRQAVENTEANVRWRATNEQTINQWLQA